MNQYLRVDLPVFEPVDEAQRLPAFVDRARLVVDEAVLKADFLHRVETEVGVDLRRLLRPGDPEAVRRIERLLQRREAALQVGPWVVKKATTPTPGFAPSFCANGVPE